MKQSSVDKHELIERRAKLQAKADQMQRGWNGRFDRVIALRQRANELEVFNERQLEKLHTLRASIRELNEQLGESVDV